MLSAKKKRGLGNLKEGNRLLILKTAGTRSIRKEGGEIKKACA